jgi:energy-coupling factor transporter ATP-binding protein EcfA2
VSINRWTCGIASGIGLIATIYASSINPSFAKVWWSATGLGFSIWGLCENKQAFVEAWEDNCLASGERKIFVGRQSQIIQMAIAPRPVQVPVHASAGMLPPSYSQADDDHQPEPFDLKRYLVDEATGILICGNSGAGKTSAAVEIAGMLTENAPAEIIVLDPHFNDQWGEAGLQAISKIDEIERAIELLERELDERHERKRLGKPQGNKILIITDELLSCKARFKDPKKVGNILSRLSTEGRKRDMLFIGISHSPNADDIDISAEVRTSFAVLKLCKSAQKHVKLWKDSDPRKTYILNHSGYPAMVDDEIVDHPTHAHHPQFKKNGNEPKYQHSINQLDWTILDESGNWLGDKKLISYSEPVPPREPKSEDYHRIIANLEKSLEYEFSDTQETELPEHLQLIVNFSSEKGWVNASKVKAGIRAFRETSTEQINEYFVNLSTLGIGAIRQGKKTPEYSVNPTD